MVLHSMIDLHMHSTFSDGTLTPAELVAEAKNVGLSAMALTDHDTTEGTRLLSRLATAEGIETISGFELSSDWHEGELHILGYGVDLNNDMLQEHLQWIRGGRRARNQEIMRNLQQAGIHISWDDVDCSSGLDHVGRVHIAAALKKLGVVKNRNEAFKRWLKEGRPAFAPKRALEPIACIDLIRSVGGVSVAAHPFTMAHTTKRAEAMIRELVRAGLDGIEVYYPSMSADQTAHFKALAAELKILGTGGSDFHGEHSPGVSMGTGRHNNLNIPHEVFVSLQERIASRRKPRR
jgi:predicted metal-dependent phosphoesterase TrpH